MWLSQGIGADGEARIRQLILEKNSKYIHTHTYTYICNYIIGSPKRATFSTGNSAWHRVITYMAKEPKEERKGIWIFTTESSYITYEIKIKFQNKKEKNCQLYYTQPGWPALESRFWARAALGLQTGLWGPWGTWAGGANRWPPLGPGDPGPLWMGPQSRFRRPSYNSAEPSTPREQCALQAGKGFQSR